MAAYLLRRILWLGPVLLFISLVTFTLMHLIEGGPWDAERPLPPEVIEQLNRQYGLDKPLWRQYLMFATNALQGDLGRSYRYQGKPVTPIIVSGIKVSGVLGALALSLAVTAGVGLGVTAALHRNRPADYAGVAFASVGSAVPGFVRASF
jgi:oligopeptide transport system permease protein